MKERPRYLLGKLLRKAEKDLEQAKARRSGVRAATARVAALRREMN